MKENRSDARSVFKIVRNVMYMVIATKRMDNIWIIM